MIDLFISLLFMSPSANAVTYKTADYGRPYLYRYTRRPDNFRSYLDRPTRARLGQEKKSVRKDRVWDIAKSNTLDLQIAVPKGFETRSNTLRKTAGVWQLSRNEGAVTMYATNQVCTKIRSHFVNCLANYSRAHQKAIQKEIPSWQFENGQSKRLSKSLISSRLSPDNIFVYEVFIRAQGKKGYLTTFRHPQTKTIWHLVIMDNPNDEQGATFDREIIQRFYQRLYSLPERLSSSKQVRWQKTNQAITRRYRTNKQVQRPKSFTFETFSYESLGLSFRSPLGYKLKHHTSKNGGEDVLIEGPDGSIELQLYRDTCNSQTRYLNRRCLNNFTKNFLTQQIPVPKVLENQYINLQIDRSNGTKSDIAKKITIDTAKQRTIHYFFVHPGSKEIGRLTYQAQKSDESWIMNELSMRQLEGGLYWFRKL